MKSGFAPTGILVAGALALTTMLTSGAALADNCAFRVHQSYEAWITLQPGAEAKGPWIKPAVGYARDGGWVFSKTEVKGRPAGVEDWALYRACPDDGKEHGFVVTEDDFRRHFFDTVDEQQVEVTAVMKNDTTWIAHYNENGRACQFYMQSLGQQIGETNGAPVYLGFVKGGFCRGLVDLEQSQAEALKFLAHLAVD